MKTNRNRRLAARTADRNAPGAPTASVLQTEVAVDALVDTMGRLYDPDKILREAGLHRADLDRLMADDEIAGAMDTRRDAVMVTPWRLEPADESPVSEFIREELDAHAATIIRAAWSAVPYGYSVAECVYGKRADGRVGIERYSEKPLRWFEPRPDGTLLFYPSTGVARPVDTFYKFFLARRDPTYANPFGEALLSRLYWPFVFRHNGWRFWMQYLDRFGDPLLLAKANKPADLIERLRLLGINNVIAVPREDEITAVTTTAAGEFERVEQSLARRIQKLVLGQTLTTDTQGTGSYALGEVHNAVRMDKRSADLRLCQAVLQRVVNALVAINFPAAEPPHVRLADDAGIEPVRAERDAKLVQAGAVRLTKAYLLRAYDYVEGDIETPEPDDAEPENAPPPQFSAAHLAARPNPASFTRAQREIETLTDLAQLEAGQPIDPQEIRAAILAARDREDLEERLAIIMGGRTNPIFRIAMARALFAANVLGYVASEQQSGTRGVTETTAAQPLALTVNIEGNRPSTRTIRRQPDGTLVLESEPHAHQPSTRE